MPSFSFSTNTPLAPGDPPDITIVVERTEKAMDGREYRFTIQHGAGEPVLREKYFRKHLSTLVYESLHDLEHIFEPQHMNYRLNRSEIGLLRDAVLSRAANVGAALWKECLPEGIGNQLANLLDGLKKYPTVQIISQERYIPWELLCPDEDYRDVEKEHFLCERAAVARWQIPDPFDSDDATWHPPPTDVSFANCVLTGAWMGEATPLRGKFGSVEVEREIGEIGRMLRDKDCQVHEIPAEWPYLIERFRKNYDLYHIAAHGVPDDDHSLCGLQLNDAPLRASDIPSQRLHPFVFVNSCHAGRSWRTENEASIGGWAERWIIQGCGAFVGPLFSVADDVAGHFAREFYEQVLRHRVPFGEAFRLARAAVKPKSHYNLTWLAYGLYGDCLGRWYPERPA